VEVFYTNTISTPVSTSYVGDEDLTLRGTKIITEEGFDVFRENYLLSAVDACINNYNSLILTSPTHNNNIFELQSIDYPHQTILTATIKSNNVYLAFLLGTLQEEFVEECTQSAVFDIEILNEITIRISHLNVDTRYYLHYNGTNFYFNNTIDTKFTNFRYVRDGDRLFLFYRSNTSALNTTPTSSPISYNAATNRLVSDTNLSWKDCAFTINTLAQDIRHNLDVTWASYDTVEKNRLEVDPAKSISFLDNNNLFYTNYTYVTGNTIFANYFTLKNNHSHKNNSYRADNLVKTNARIPNVSMRNYVSMHTGVHQELGADSITLAYEYYNADYKFAADKYTIFRTPPSMYPFEQLNVNDALFVKNGAIAGDTPYTADRIFFRDERPGKSDGQFLCTWLSGAPGEPGVWVDRYYIPERTTFAAALTTRSNITYTDPTQAYVSSPLPPSGYYDAPYYFSSVEEEFEHTPQTLKDVLYGEDFFDKKSDLIFLPDTEYIYYRIGKNYVDAIVNSLTASLIKDGVDIQTSRGVSISYDVATDDIEYVLDGDSYALIEEFKDVNSTNEFTISFWMDADDWTAPLGHEIVGNYNDRGFGIFNDQVVTPIIMVQNDKSVLYLNSDFDVIDTVYLSQSALNSTTTTTTLKQTDTAIESTITNTFYLIKDIFRTDHLDFCAPILNKYQTSFTLITAIPPQPPPPTCGILQDERLDAITPDNLATTDSIPVTAIQLEPCSYDNKIQLNSVRNPGL
jgi:hypothetical protein